MIKRAAVFGGAGFIGTNLVYQLIDSGCQVFNFDNLSGLGNLLNIAELMQQSRHSFARCDVTNPEEIRQSLLMAAPDTIFLCITPKNLESGECLKPIETFLDTLSDWAGISSGKEVSFRKLVVVVSEFHKSQGRLGKVYEAFKKLTASYVDKGLPVSTVLVPMCFGPFQQPDSPIPLIIYRAIEGETIPVLNPGRSSQDLVYVKDVVQAILLVEDKGKNGEHYQLEGFKPELTNFEVADTICDVLNQALPPPMGRYQALIDELRSDRPLVSDIQKNENGLLALGPLTKTPTREGLVETVKWYLENNHWYSQSKTRFFYLWQNPKDVLISA